MEIIGNLKPTNFENTMTYKIEHLPELDVVINLDYSDQKEQDVVLEIIRNNKLNEDFTIEQLLLRISSYKDIGGQQFFVKTKPQTVKSGSKELIDLIKNPTPEMVTDDFENKKARYGLAGVLNEIILSKKVKELVSSDPVQVLARKHNFEGIKFSEPICALIDRKNIRKYLIYKHVEDKHESFGKNIADLENLSEDLRAIFIQNNINPTDLKSSQFIINEEEEGKPFVVLIDIETYTEEKFT